MSTTLVSFDCGAGIILESGQTVAEVIADHEEFCGMCPDERTEHEVRLDMEAQKKWEARVDGALAEARRTA